jgi:hypothetical protein
MGRRDEELTFERGVVHERRRVQLDRDERLAVAWVDELHTQQEPAPPHLFDDLGAFERRFELIAQAGSSVADPLHQVPFDEEIEDRQADADDTGAPSHVCPRSNSRDPRSIASYTSCLQNTPPSGAYPAPRPFPTVTMSGSIGS